MPSAKATSAVHENKCFTVPPQIDRCSGSAFDAHQPHCCAETIPPGDLTRQLEIVWGKKDCNPRSRRYVSSSSTLFKERKVDCAGHGFVTGVVWMEMVATIVHGKGSRRMCRIAHHCIEVDHSVVPAARANKLIHGLAFDLT